jgi:hypothetical protein
MSIFRVPRCPSDNTNIEYIISYYEQSRNYLLQLNDQLIGRFNYKELQSLPIFDANNVVEYHMSVHKYFSDLINYFLSVR